MDPQATLDLIRDYVREGRLEDALELTDALLEWLRRGGFTPADISPVFEAMEILEGRGIPKEVRP